MKKYLLIGLVVSCFNGLVGVKVSRNSIDSVRSDRSSSSSVDWAPGSLLHTPQNSSHVIASPHDPDEFLKKLKQFGDSLESDPEQWIEQMKDPCNDFFKSHFGIDATTPDGVNESVVFGAELQKRASKLSVEYSQDVQGIADICFIKALKSPYLYGLMRAQIEYDLRSAGYSIEQ